MGEHLKWLRTCQRDPQCPLNCIPHTLGVGPLPSLGMLTGQDSRALAAIGGPS